MPPKWSLGYHQCRWSYDSSEKVLKVFSCQSRLSVYIGMGGCNKYIMCFSSMVIIFKLKQKIFITRDQAFLACAVS